jgi:hypothetical protein
MAPTTIQTNNKLVQYTQQINREYVRENLFSPYMSEDITAIIRLRNELKKGGEQVNIPLVSRLTGAGFSTGTLVGSEEAIDDYGCRVYVDFARNAVRMNAREEQIDSADLFGEAKPLLSDWGKELQRDEIIEALMALPTESAPANLGSSAGQRTNGILFEAASVAQRNTWNSDNSDRVLYGNTTANYNATFLTALANIDATADLFKGTSVQLMKYVAKNASPKIRPFKVTDGREYFVIFAGSLNFRDLKADLVTVNKDARPREGTGFDKNPIFQDGDLVYDGVIIREVPEIDTYTSTVWTSLAGTGTGALVVNNPRPVFLCGQAAVAMAWARMAKPTFLKEDDYGFLKGTGIEMCYGTAKLFKKHPKAGTALKQWGVVTGFFAASAT